MGSAPGPHFLLHLKNNGMFKEMRRENTAAGEESLEDYLQGHKLPPSFHRLCKSYSLFGLGLTGASNNFFHEAFSFVLSHMGLPGAIGP